MLNGHRKIIEAHCAQKLTRADFLPGGCVGEVWRLTFEDGTRLVAKTAFDNASLDIEAYMLGYVKDNSQLPLPKVHLALPDLLVLEYIENDGALPKSAEIDAAQHLASLHKITIEKYGLNRDTLIGSLDQPNPETTSWVNFFRDHRLMYLGKAAQDAGQLPEGCFKRLEDLCAKLDTWIIEPAQPSLIHGDIWGGNVLFNKGKVAAFIDPAVHYADREIELAYLTLFNTFGSDFFAHYQDLYPIIDGFFDCRKTIYLLYPLLVHARLFGGNYGHDVDKILRRFVG
jgi:fructosamine-3-kinase